MKNITRLTSLAALGSPVSLATLGIKAVAQGNPEHALGASAYHWRPATSGSTTRVAHATLIGKLDEFDSVAPAARVVAASAVKHMALLLGFGEEVPGLPKPFCTELPIQPAAASALAQAHPMVVRGALAKELEQLADKAFVSGGKTAALRVFNFVTETRAEAETRELKGRKSMKDLRLQFPDDNLDDIFVVKIFMQHTPERGLSVFHSWLAPAMFDGARHDAKRIRAEVAKIENGTPLRTGMPPLSEGSARYILSRLAWEVAGEGLGVDADTGINMPSLLKLASAVGLPRHEAATAQHVLQRISAAGLTGWPALDNQVAMLKTALVTAKAGQADWLSFALAKMAGIKPGRRSASEVEEMAFIAAEQGMDSHARLWLWAANQGLPSLLDVTPDVNDWLVTSTGRNIWTPASFGTMQECIVEAPDIDIAVTASVEEEAPIVVTPPAEEEKGAEVEVHEETQVQTASPEEEPEEESEEAEVTTTAAPEEAPATEHGAAEEVQEATEEVEEREEDELIKEATPLVRQPEAMELPVDEETLVAEAALADAEAREQKFLANRERQAALVGVTVEEFIRMETLVETRQAEAAGMSVDDFRAATDDIKEAATELVAEAMVAEATAKQAAAAAKAAKAEKYRQLQAQLREMEESGEVTVE